MEFLVVEWLKQADQMEAVVLKMNFLFVDQVDQVEEVELKTNFLFVDQVEEVELKM
jgi:hypothetical protein